MAYLLDKLSNIEFRLSHGVSEKLQLGNADNVVIFKSAFVPNIYIIYTSIGTF